jgi:hypothetical protein
MKVLKRRITTSLLAGLLVSQALLAADPTEALSLDKEVGKDLELTLWAKSPMIHSPVAMDVDPQGVIGAVHSQLSCLE